MSDTFDSVRDEIRRKGLRATPARVTTLLTLRRATSPQTHAEVSDQVAHGGIDKATVFRNLNDLAEVGLVRRGVLGDHVWRFEAVRDVGDQPGGHPHFLCVDCGTVSCLDDVRLTAGSLRRSAEVGEITEILLRGHCNDCAGR